MAESSEFEHIIDGDGPTDRALDAGYDCRAYFPDGSYTRPGVPHVPPGHHVRHRPVWEGSAAGDSEVVGGGGKWTRFP